jgi:hypothetical protein
MAGDWIKMRIDLAEDPAVIGMASQLDLDEYAVVGRLHKIWGWADRQCRDGHAAGVKATWIDRHVAQPGFSAAMQEVGWLEVNDGYAKFPRFERHNGQNAKSRALGNNRQQVHRATSPSRSPRDENVTREEEEKSINTPLPPTGGDAVFEALVAEYPAHRRNVGAAFKRWRAINPDGTLQSLIMQAAKVQARSPEWQANNGKAVPNLSGWLLNEGWRRTHNPQAPAALTAVARNEGAQVVATSSAEVRKAGLEKLAALKRETTASIAGKRVRAIG